MHQFRFQVGIFFFATRAGEQGKCRRFFFWSGNRRCGGGGLQPDVSLRHERAFARTEGRANLEASAGASIDSSCARKTCRSKMLQVFALRE